MAKIKIPLRAADHDIILTEAAQGFWTHYASETATREDVLKPEYWANATHKLQPMAEVRIMPKDSSWYGRYLVMQVEGSAAKLVELEFHKLDHTAASDMETSAHYVRYQGPVGKFCVFRKSDDARIQEGMKKDEAIKWMLDHEKQMAA